MEREQEKTARLPAAEGHDHGRHRAEDGRRWREKPENLQTAIWSLL
jgi:hypothetical protein